MSGCCRSVVTRQRVPAGATLSPNNKCLSASVRRVPEIEVQGSEFESHPSPEEEGATVRGTDAAQYDVRWRHSNQRLIPVN